MLVIMVVATMLLDVSMIFMSYMVMVMFLFNDLLVMVIIISIEA